MNEEKIKKSIAFAKRIADQETEYKSEIFTATMLGSLLDSAMPAKKANSDIVTAPAETSQSKKKLSLREFLISKSPKSDVERTAVYAYFLENFEGKPSFTVRDIIDAFRNSKEPVPKNPSDKIQKCISKGWFTKGEESNTYTLTNTGISAVETNFNNEGG